MARTHRKSTPSIKDILLTEPYRFEFHQAVRLLEELRPESIPFGETVIPSQEVVEVKSRVYLDSLASDIYSLDNTAFVSKAKEPPVLNVNFMGIAGIQGPLPFPYTELIIQRIRNGDKSLRDFLDIFNHRLISILHRIRKQYLLSLNAHSPEKTEVARGLFSFTGLGMPSLQKRLCVPDRSLLDYASLYWTHPRSALGLEQILTTYFKLPVKIKKCVGRWRPLPKDQVTYLKKGNSWQKLGQGAVLGSRIWDQATHFSLHLGPLTLDQLDLFLPNGKGFPRFKEIIDLYVPPPLDFSTHYHVKSPPSTLLGRQSYLGWRSWLGTSLKTGGDVRVS